MAQEKFTLTMTTKLFLGPLRRANGQKLKKKLNRTEGNTRSPKTNRHRCICDVFYNFLRKKNVLRINKPVILLNFRYCDNRRKVLLAHVHEGYEKEWWLYTDPDC